MSAFDFPSHTWLPHAGERHAYLGDKLADGDPVTVFCGQMAEARTYHVDAPERLWPECDVCREKAVECVDRRAAAERRRLSTLAAYADPAHCRLGCRCD
ncbi:zinc finger protein [Streptoalloteichus hindustanus]|uniref:Zinc-finger n=1 Tax=Streptoalloteichus hindustanus TaxID=2017 RepID=A0A1M4YMY3_STRHI|nr:zinc finger protein [Streptoalloteichus hindustanus]SHF07013.1 zinc-finger [Streptoalloteichus hindustanus]